MLRRPSIRHTQRLGEGCSSIAFGLMPTSPSAAWANPAVRGSADGDVGMSPALP
jgi:hypothetical protein